MRFESKRDTWLIVLLRGVPIVAMVIVGSVWYAQRGDWRGPVLGIVVLLFAELFLFEWMFRSTYYVIEGDTLLIRSGIVSWRVPIRDIRAITPARSPASSPALSLDRLRIDYGRRAILVSPEDRHRFIAALRSVNPAISV